MAVYDLQIMPHANGEIWFEVLGKEEDDGWMLLQRIWTLMLADQADVYREKGSDINLLQFLEGGNTPDDEVMDAILAASADAALGMLDEADRRLIASFTARAENGRVICNLSLRDGTTLEGRLSVDG